MKKCTPKPKQQPEEPATHPWEAWKPRRILRSQIVSADYNPRTISDNAKRRLKAGMRKLHLLQPLVWNVRTGVLVGGHQRLSVLDANAAGARDYYLTVSEVDLDPKQEVEANLLLNNAEAGGEMDIEKLRAVFNLHPSLDVEATGYERVDILRMFGANKAETATPEELAEMGKSLDEMRELADKIAETSRKRDDGLFYLVVIFEDSDASAKFVRDLKLTDDQFQSARDMLGALREHGIPSNGDD